MRQYYTSKGPNYTEFKVGEKTTVKKQTKVSNIPQLSIYQKKKKKEISNLKIILLI